MQCWTCAFSPTSSTICPSLDAKSLLPAYSPGHNPIEPAWAKVKVELRRVAARTVEALHAACDSALDAITAQDAARFFRHCGYIRPG